MGWEWLESRTSFLVLAYVVLFVSVVRGLSRPVLT